MKVYNMLSSKGNEVKNQFIIEYNLNLTAFQSYDTLIAVYDNKNDVMYCDEYKYSHATSKYLNRFLRKFSPLHIQEVENSELHKIIERV